MAILDRRELERNYYLAIRKLYLCLDSEGFYEVVKRIEKNSMAKSSVKGILELLRGIGDYHLGNRMGLIDGLTRLNVPKNYEYWRHVYIGLEDHDQIQMVVLRNTLKATPSIIKEIANQRLLLMDVYGASKHTVGDIMAVRSQLTYNLLIAEATSCLEKIETDVRLKDYYKKSANNLIKDFTI